MSREVSLLTTVRNTLRESPSLIRDGSGIVVGCSGGPDSVALTHVLWRLAKQKKLSIHVAYVNHGLRPEAALEAEAVGQWVSGLGLPFHSLRVNVPKTKAIQETARARRYHALLALAGANGGDRVAVGHTADDQSETVLARILRGSGIRGLGGIAPIREDGIVRPLIDARRSQVLEYVRHQGLPVVADKSNEDRRFQRVRIRHELLPMLVREDAEVVAHLNHLAKDAREAMEVLVSLARVALDDLSIKSGGKLVALKLKELKKTPPGIRGLVVQRFIREVTGASPDRRHLAAIDQLRGKKSRVLLGSGWSLAVENQNELTLQRSSNRLRTRSNREDP